MSLLFFNGFVHTLDERNSIYDAIVTDGVKIAAVAESDALLREWPDAEKIDLEGAHVYPGFVDAHAHVYGMGERLTKVRLEGTRSKTEIYDRVSGVRFRASEGKEAGKLKWIVSRGWDQTVWSDQADHAFPTKEELDKNVSNTQPIALTRIDGHALWCNSLSLTLAGITRETEDPLGGAILHDTEGEPTGILLDEAMMLVESKILPPTIEDTIATLRVGLQYFLKRGHVAVHEMGVSAELWEAYAKLYEREGESLPKVYVFLDMTKPTGKQAFLDYCSTSESLPTVGGGGVGEARLTMTGIKLYLDGALGSRGAQLLEDYSDDPGNRGLALMEDVEVMELMRLAAERGLQIAVHAIGDKANARALDLFTRLRNDYPLPNSRHPTPDTRYPTLRIEHGQIVREEDVSRFAELGVFALVQPAFFASDRRWAVERLGEERMRTAYRWKSFLDAGVKFIASSDAPIEEPDPIVGIALLTNRDDVNDGEHLTIDQAIRAYAQTPYELTDNQQQGGTLAPGKRADLTILNGELPSVTVREVVIGGQRVSERI